MTSRLRKITDWSTLIDRPISYLRRKFGLVTPAGQPGMGAVMNEETTSFRVWAPHAESVFLVGSFNGWSPWRTPLAREDDGCWSIAVPEVCPGDEYKYVIHRAGETMERTDPYARKVTRPQQNGIVVPVTEEGTEHNSYSPPPLNEMIVYELHVGTFAHSAGDSSAGPVGSFRSVEEKLPYLQSLGINAIELMPVMEFAGDYSWGYNPGHPFAVSNAYGGREALQSLIRNAHDYGIAVIIDVVYNHFGPQELALWQYDGWHEHGNGGIYFYNDWRAETPWAHTRPDYGRAEVRRYLAENALMWLVELGADGLRWDATSYIRTTNGIDGDELTILPDGWHAMRQINDEIHSYLPGRVSIAEDMQNNASITRAADQGGAGFDAQWDAGFVHTVRDVIIRAHDEERSMTALSKVLSARFIDRAFDRVVFTESHDEVANGKARVPHEISPDDPAGYFAKKRSALGAVLVLTAPGVPMLFQGQEFLADGWFDDHAPLDWTKHAVNEGILRLFKDLVRLRRNRDGYSAGLAGPHIHTYHIDEKLKVLAYHRWAEGGPGDDVVVVANFANHTRGAYTVGFPREGIWRVRFNSDLRSYATSFGGRACPDVIAANTQEHGIDALPCWGNVTLAPYTALVFSQDRESE